MTHTDEAPHDLPDPALRIPCPVCRAITGQPCRPPLWPSDVGGTHRERVEAWRNPSPTHRQPIAGT